MDSTFLDIVFTLAIFFLGYWVVILIIQALARKNLFFTQHPPRGTFMVIELGGVLLYALDGDNPPKGFQYLWYHLAGAHWIGITHKVAVFIWQQQTIKSAEDRTPEGVSEPMERELVHIPRHFVFGTDVPAVDNGGFSLRLLLESTYEILHGHELEFCAFIRNTPNWLTALVDSPLIALTKFYTRNLPIEDIRGADTTSLDGTFQTTFRDGMNRILTFIKLLEILQLDFLDESAGETNEALQEKKKTQLHADALFIAEEGKTKRKGEELKQAQLQQQIEMLGVNRDAAYVKEVIAVAAQSGPAALRILEKEQLSKIKNLTTYVEAGATASVMVDTRGPEKTDTSPTPPEITAPAQAAAPVEPTPAPAAPAEETRQEGGTHAH